MSKNIENKSIAIFENEPVRRIWSKKNEKWYFSVVDIVRVLAQNDRPRKYWDDLKRKLKIEGSGLSEKIGQLKFMSKDGKYYSSDAADVETVLRIVQSIPSPKAEPFKLWLAKTGYERLRETVDPEIAVNRAREHWQTLGRSEKWIEQRMRGQEIRNKLTDYWATHKVTEQEEYAILTDIIHKEWSGISVKKHKEIKKLKGHNLRDNMTEAELIFTTLAELTTRNVAEKDLAIGLGENSISAIKGGRYAGKARSDFEKLTGKKVVSENNFLPPVKKIKKLK
ncbi:MAG: prophage antirepressor [uncultured bacterium]|nr:MAG: prophage antirepressor [uncultured bacterium]